MLKSLYFIFFIPSLNLMWSCSLLYSLAEVLRSTSYPLSVSISLPPIHSTASVILLTNISLKLPLLRSPMNVMLNLMNKYLSHGKPCPLGAMTPCFRMSLFFACSCLLLFTGCSLSTYSSCLSELISLSPTLPLPSASC